MQIKLDIVNKILVASINGDIDHHTCSEIKSKIDRITESQSVKNVIFDFKNVNFMDSSGIGVIIGRYKNINKVGGKICVVNLTPQTKRIFEISGLFNIIPYYNDINSAMKSI